MLRDPLTSSWQSTTNLREKVPWSTMIGVPGGTSCRMGDRCLFAWVKPLVIKRDEGRW